LGDIINKKIFIGLTEISGYCANLKKGFDEIGEDCTFITLSQQLHNYGNKYNSLFFTKIYRWLDKQQEVYQSRFKQAPFYISKQLIKFLIFIWALTNYKIFIFVFGQSFYYGYDLPILRCLNKKIIFVFLGSDARPPYINGAVKNAGVDDYYKISIKMKKNIKFIEKYSDATINNMTCCHFHEKPILKFALIGLPYIYDDYNICTIKKENYIKILHAPSDPIGKGSDHIRTAIRDIRDRGYKIEYIELTGKPHSEVIEQLQSCDFVVDQVFAGPLGGFSTEAAWFGKPAVIGGYYAEYIQDDYSPEDIPPCLFCHPDKIMDAIERLIRDENYRLELGKSAQEFVRTRWTPEEIAKCYLKIIESNIPVNWFFDPHDVYYLQGYGLPEDKSKEIIRAMVKKYGVKSLCLSDKPKLEQRFIEYAFDSKKY